MAQTVKLSIKSLDALKAADKRKEYPDGRIAGLYFVVQPTGMRSWAVRYRNGNRSRKMKLGDYPSLSLAAARGLAAEALAAVATGVDPAQQRAEIRSGIQLDSSNQTVEVAVEAYLAREVEPRRRSAAQTRAIFTRRVIPSWGKRSVNSITRTDVAMRIDAILDEGLPVAANSFFAAVRRFFNWAIERGICEVSPCKGMKMPTPEVSRDRVLSDFEVRLLWAATAAEGYPFGPLVRLLLLTGQRRDEVAGMRWREVDLDNRIWAIPRSRTKNGRAHQVPLPALAITELSGLPRIASPDGLVFTTNGRSHFSGYSKSKLRLDRKMAHERDSFPMFEASQTHEVHLDSWRLHDLRRTAASGMARLGAPVHVIEAILNHRTGAIRGVAAIYNRYDYALEKVTAMDAWASHVATLGAAPSNAP